MKIVSEKESAKIIEKYIYEYERLNKLPIHSIWIAIKPIILVFVSTLSSILAISFFNTYKNDIMSLLGINQPSFYAKIIIAILGFMAILFILIPMILVHELIHFLCCKLFKKHCVIVVNKPFGISVLCLDWHSKSNELCTLILPFLIFLIFSIILWWTFSNVFVFMWLTIINSAISSADLVNCIIILIKVPRGSLILGHYFRRQ